MMIAMMTIPRADLESVYEAGDIVMGLYLAVTPILLVCLFVCSKFRQSLWIVPFWTVVVVPFLVFLFLL